MYTSGYRTRLANRRSAALFILKKTNAETRLKFTRRLSRIIHKIALGYQYFNGFFGPTGRTTRYAMYVRYLSVSIDTPHRHVPDILQTVISEHMTYRLSQIRLTSRHRIVSPGDNDMR